MSTRCRKNIIGYLSKIYIVPMCDINLDRLTVNFLYFTDTFYLSLTDYVYYIINFCQSDIGKARSVIYVNYI